MLRSNPETLKKRFFDMLGYWPDLENPKTIQEKLLWRKLYEDMSEAVRLSDKVAVRDYVRDVVGERYLVDVLAIADDANDLDFDALPDSFVLKINRASSANLVVDDKSRLDVAAIRRILNSMLRLEYGRRLGEHWYSAIPPKILAERLLVDETTTIPVDYRFHTFHGKVFWLQVSTDKFLSDDAWGQFRSAGQKYVDTRRTVDANYGLDWQPAPFHGRTHPPYKPLPKTPGPADEMIEVAEKLAGDWGYVRIDLYCLNDRDVYFSEMTFVHNSGLFPLFPERYCEYLGSLWDIHRRYVRDERPPMPLFT